MNSLFFQMTRQTDISDYGHAVRIARFGGCKTSLDAIKVSGVPRPKAIRPRYWTAAGRIYNYTKPRLPPESRVPKHVHTNIHKAVSVGPVFSENDESDTALGRMRPHRSYKGTMCRQSAAFASNFFTRSSLLGLIYLAPLLESRFPSHTFRKGEAKGGEGRRMKGCAGKEDRTSEEMTLSDG